eukprot:CAMPEP_0194144234 /NCGR_PEP_ID=MMETSP0152-20130528/13308_1 /TAXON_ID=1049557 /ORGANISM="Thalassiothrix antarctica, Strain L6-D1" /LENGTH=297 /DNA_ID=CAMNT_0038843991 /DNA_START=99 /DNA_END=992 /DNA_ORIENTATION=+
MLAMFEKKEGNSSSMPRLLTNPRVALRQSSFNKKTINKLKIIGDNASNLFKGGKTPSEFSLRTESGLTATESGLTAGTADTDDSSSLLNGEDIKLAVKPIESNDSFPEIDDATLFSDVWNTDNFDEEGTECDIREHQSKPCVEKLTEKEEFTNGTFDEDVEGEYNSLFGSTEEDDETYWSLEGEPPSPTSRLMESFSSMFNCGTINSSFVSLGNNTSHTSRRNPDLDLSFEQKAQKTGEAMKLVYSEGIVAVGELFVELKEDCYEYSKIKIDELKFELANRKEKKQHTTEQQKHGFV